MSVASASSSDMNKYTHVVTKLDTLVLAEITNVLGTTPDKDAEGC